MTSSARVDAALVEHLLYGSEGVDLDFKRDQYSFEGAPDSGKAELLKDILAFANAFRRSDAFILIGVEEVPGGRARVVGVADHLKDADLQQFVNTKTNRNIVFSYHAVEIEGKHVGVIRIQDQQRPIFLRKDFGTDAGRNRPKLAANQVYFRIGSSTRDASPEDIARMGSHAAHHPVFDVDLQFANFRDKTDAGYALHTTHSFLRCDETICDYRSHSMSGWPFDQMALARSPMHSDNSNFWRDAYNYLAHWHTLAEVGFCIRNRGDTTIDDVTVEIVLAASDRFVCVPAVDMPDRPVPRFNLLYPSHAGMPTYNSCTHVEKRGDRIVVTLSFGKLQAGELRFLSDALYVGNPTEKHVVTDAVIRADQFRSPLLARLEFHALGTVTSLKWDELQRIIEDQFFQAELDNDD